MRLSGHPGMHLTYCLNVHPGETWAENIEAIRTQARAVKAAVAPGAPFGLGLRLGRAAAETLLDTGRRAAFRDLLAAEGMYVFTINGFPYGAFHGTRVKEAVYRPDWRAPERLAYTLMLAEILADLLPEGVRGSISTVPGAYREEAARDADRAAIAGALGRVAVALDRLAGERGRELCLGLEPEPDCLIETTGEMIAFMDRDMRDHALPVLRRETGGGAARGEAILRRRIGLCLDTCHLAMQFEDPSEGLRRARAAGVEVCKVQLSAALTARVPPVTAARLAAFDDDVYLHQVRIRAGGRVRRFADLRPALTAAARADGTSAEWRIHCHVPLYYTGEDGLGSTAGDLTAGFLAQVAREGVDHLEIETYTFGVLPAPLRARGVTGSIADEFAWVMERV